MSDKQVMDGGDEVSTLKSTRKTIKRIAKRLRLGSKSADDSIDDPDVEEEKKEKRISLRRSYNDFEISGLPRLSTDSPWQHKSFNFDDKRGSNSRSKSRSWRFSGRANKNIAGRHSSNGSSSSRIPKELRVSYSEKSNNLEQLHLLLSHADGYEMLLEFCEQEFSQESILFWKAVDDFREWSKNIRWKPVGNEQESSSLVQKTKDKAEEIYKEYIAPNSPNCVNIGFMYKSVRDALDQDDLTFDEVYNVYNGCIQEILWLVAQDSFQRFKDTDEYIQAFVNVIEYDLED